MVSPLRRLVILGLFLLDFGCATSQFATLAIYETPGAYVRLEVDRMFGTNHSHPASLTPEQVAAVLSGIVIEERLAKLPVVDDMSQPRRHPVFTQKEIELLAPLASLALKRATPEEIVTFYKSIPPSGIRREVTSGGLFVDRDELHVVVANYRSPTHYMPDPQAADTTDDRLVPTKPIAPQRGQLDFEPKEAKREPSRTAIGDLFHWDRREVIVLWEKIPPRADRTGQVKE
jgi:hypothetical protein